MAASPEAPLKGQSTDQAVATNLVFCLSVGTLLFVTFCFLRRIFRELYAVNVLNTRRYGLGAIGGLYSLASVVAKKCLHACPTVSCDG